jgi:hypothetical protein
MRCSGDGFCSTWLHLTYTTGVTLLLFHSLFERRRADQHLSPERRPKGESAGNKSPLTRLDG